MGFLEINSNKNYGPTSKITGHWLKAWGTCTMLLDDHLTLPLTYEMLFSKLQTHVFLSENIEPIFPKRK